MLEIIQCQVVLHLIRNEFNALEIDEEELRGSFIIARELFKRGQLSTCKTLIDLYVDSVLVYDNYVELRVKIKPDLSVYPDKARNKSGFLQSSHKSCGYHGAEGGTRTHTVSLPPDFESGTSAIPSLRRFSKFN